MLSPSPSTVLYTVSTRSPRITFSAKLLRYVLLILRILLGTATSLFLLFKLVEHPWAIFIYKWLADAWIIPAWFGVPTSLGLPEGWMIPEWIAEFIRAQPWRECGPIAFVVLFLVFRRYHTEESLLVLRTLGIQTKTLSSSYLIPSTVRFLPTSQIRDVFIHEAFMRFEVRYYLAIVVEREEEVKVVFPQILPGRKVLEEVWRGTRECLHEPKQ